MSKRISLPLLLLLLVAVGAGCRMLGFETQLGSRTEIEATIDTLARAGEAGDEATLQKHLATTILMEVLSGDAYDGPEEESKEEVIERIRSIWDDMTSHSVNVSLGSVDVYGREAVADGAFVFRFTDSQGRHAVCTGSGEASFHRASGNWQVNAVTVSAYSCDVSEPGKSSSTDGNDGFVAQAAAAAPMAASIAPHFRFDICEYLVVGAAGDQVRALQGALRYLGHNPGLIDGDFGPKTRTAVRNFQKAAGLYVDGEAGPKTLSALDLALRKKGGAFECHTALSAPRAGETYLQVDALRQGTSYETPVYIYDSPHAGPTIVLIGCIHGNERSGHLALTEAIDRGITISKGRLIVVPEFNRNACRNNTRTYNGYDFNRLFPVGKTPTHAIGREMWDLLTSQPNLALVVDFHDGFNNSLANTLITSRQTKMRNAAAKMRDALNAIRPSGARGPRWRSLTEPIAGSLTRKVGRDLGVPALEVELAGRTNPDPLSLRKRYAHLIIKQLGAEFGMQISY